MSLNIETTQGLERRVAITVQLKLSLKPFTKNLNVLQKKMCA